MAPGPEEGCAGESAQKGILSLLLVSGWELWKWKGARLIGQGAPVDAPAVRSSTGPQAWDPRVPLSGTTWKWERRVPHREDTGTTAHVWTSVPPTKPNFHDLRGDYRDFCLIMRPPLTRYGQAVSLRSHQKCRLTLVWNLAQELLDPKRRF
ncbi:unnamed protein product, partial [Nesidiocoris tenuis]